MLTNAYQAEYGRAVGGQMQVVTKSGTQAFHGSGYWYGRRSDWNANTWTNKRAAAPPPSQRNAIETAVAQRLRLHDRRPDLHPRLSTRTRRSCSSSGARSTSGAPTRPPRGRRACRPRSSAQGDFSQSVDASGNPFPYIRDYTTGLPCSAANTRGCFQDGGVLGRIPANRLYPPGLNTLNIYPHAELHGAAAASTSRARTPTARRVVKTCCGMDFQATDKWRVTGRYMNTKEDILQAYGTTWAGNGSDQLPTPTLFMHPGSNYMLSATGILNTTTSLEVSCGPRRTTR